MEHNSQHQKALNFLTVKEVLWKDWDPIGVNGHPEADDEYDGYISGVLSLLRSGADEGQLVDHLSRIETGNMGLNERPRSQIVPTARKLLAIDMRVDTK